MSSDLYILRSDNVAARQIGDELMIMSASAWKRTFKRHPRPGSKAIWILRPKSITITEK